MKGWKVKKKEVTEEIHEEEVEVDNDDTSEDESHIGWRRHSW